MLFMTTTMSMSTLVDDHETDFTQEMMISPVSRYSIVIGKIFGSSFSAIIGMLGTLIVGLFMGITLNPGQMIMILALSQLMCLSAGALTIIIIGFIKSKRVANFAVMLITMPQIFFRRYHPHRQFKRPTAGFKPYGAHDLLPRPRARGCICRYPGIWKRRAV